MVSFSLFDCRRTGCFAVLSLVAAAAPAAAEPLQITSRVLVEQRVPLPDGSVRLDQVPVARAVPGDRVTVLVTYRNTSASPIAGLTIANPVPRGLVFRSASASAEVSVDGRQFGALPVLSVLLPGGGRRPARAGDVTAVRWRLPAALPPRGAGQLSFQATIQ